jgi:hypothetical protein
MGLQAEGLPAGAAGKEWSDAWWPCRPRRLDLSRFPSTQFRPPVEYCLQSLDSNVYVHLQRFSKAPLRQVTFIERFRERANELHSQPSRMDSTVTIHLDDSEGPSTPLLSVRHGHTASGADCCVDPCI